MARQHFHLTLPYVKLGSRNAWMMSLTIFTFICDMQLTWLLVTTPRMTTQVKVRASVKHPNRLRWGPPLSASSENIAN